MGKVLAIVASFVLLCFTSCRHEPQGFETTIDQLTVLFSEGEVKEFTYVGKGSWVLAELTEEAIRSEKYTDEIDYLLNEKVITSKNEFRLMAKVISLEDFEENVRQVTGKVPVIRRVESK